jgi:hypothetical protein
MVSLIVYPVLGFSQMDSACFKHSKKDTFVLGNIVKSDNIKPHQIKNDSINLVADKTKEINVQAFGNDTVKLTAKSPENLSGYPEKSEYDRIYCKNENVLVVDIIRDNSLTVQFTYPLNNVLNSLSHNQINKIVFKDGSLEDFSLPKNVFGSDTLSKENAWKKVSITYRKRDVDGMTMLGPIEMFEEADKLSTTDELLERNATFQIRKRAARMGAKVVLIVSKKYDTVYGDVPAVSIKAEAYSH